MIRVNLLPHRAERRKAQRKHLAILAGMVAALAISIVVLVHGVIAGYISIPLAVFFGLLRYPAAACAFCH